MGRCRYRCGRRHQLDPDCRRCVQLWAGENLSASLLTSSGGRGKALPAAEYWWVLPFSLFKNEDLKYTMEEVRSRTDGIIFWGIGIYLNKKKFKHMSVWDRKTFLGLLGTRTRKECARHGAISMLEINRGSRVWYTVSRGVPWVVGSWLHTHIQWNEYIPCKMLQFSGKQPIDIGLSDQYTMYRCILTNIQPYKLNVLFIRENPI